MRAPTPPPRSFSSSSRSTGNRRQPRQPASGVVRSDHIHLALNASFWKRVKGTIALHPRFRSLASPGGNHQPAESVWLRKWLVGLRTKTDRRSFQSTAQASSCLRQQGLESCNAPPAENATASPMEYKPDPLVHRFGCQNINTSSWGQIARNLNRTKTSSFSGEDAAAITTISVYAIALSVDSLINRE